MSPVAAQSAPELLRGVGEDGVEYVIRPFRWTLEAAERYVKEFIRYKIFADDVPHTVDGFLTTMVGSHALWFEMVVAATGENVGFMYLTDLIPSLTEKRFVSATFHAVTWDAKAAPRLELVRRFITGIFKLLGLHRLQSVVPLSKGGAIRVLHRLGFKDEGIIREPIRYGGVWYGVLLLSILESEANNGNGAQ